MLTEDKKPNLKYVQSNGVLKNKFGIDDDKKLNMVERAIVNLKLSKLEMEPIVGYFDKYHLMDIHHFLFSDIYEFAGKIRDVDISKGDTLFCKSECIVKNLDSTLYKMYKENIQSREEMVRVIAYYYAELNMIHPFREGNGRTLRTFIKLFSKTRGYELSFAMVNPIEMLNATIYSVKYDVSMLESIFENCIFQDQNEINRR